jgi:hypothetical protein
MGPTEWVPSGIDVDRPSGARVYDYLLGGGHNFRADRQMVEQLLVVQPDLPLIVQANRAFMRRVVRYLVKAGVRQFLDVGSGIPTEGHVHEIAQAAAPDARVIYVDIDSVAVAHTKQILSGNDRAAVVREDIRRPEDILDAPEVWHLFDLKRPVAVLVMAVLHHLSDADDPANVLARLTGPLVAGSYLAISHGTEDGLSSRAMGKEIYRRGGMELTSRSHAQVEALFKGWDLVEPGVVWVPLWHPEWPPDPQRGPETSGQYGGVARKP